MMCNHHEYIYGVEAPTGTGRGFYVYKIVKEERGFVYERS